MVKKVAYILDINRFNTAGMSIAEGFKYAYDQKGIDCRLLDIKEFKKGFLFPRKNLAFDTFDPDVIMTSVDMIESLPLKTMQPKIFILWGQFYKQANLEEQAVPILEKTKAILNKYKDKHRFIVWSQHADEINEAFFKGYSTEMGLEFTQLIHCADERLYAEPAKDKEFDFVFIGNIAHRQSEYDKYVSPIKTLTNSFKELTDAAGFTPLEDKKWMYATSVLSPNVHTKAQRDHQIVLNERVFAATIAGGFQVCDINLAKQYFNSDEMHITEDPAEYIEICRHFLNNPGERLEYILRGQKKILNEHTYTSRVNYLLNLISR